MFYKITIYSDQNHSHLIDDPEVKGFWKQMNINDISYSNLKEIKKYQELYVKIDNKLIYFYFKNEIINLLFEKP